MSQRTRILAEVLGYQGWRVREAFFEDSAGRRIDLLPKTVVPHTTLVLRVERRWQARCGTCAAICRRKHKVLEPRRWRDLPWALHPVVIEATPVRVKCQRCGGFPVEMLGWADPYQRQTRRFQQHLALQAASMPVLHVAVMYGLDWSTVRNAEGAALARWKATREEAPLRHVGVDEKYLGRRHKRGYDYVTIVSNLETGEPVWIGPGREAATLTAWLNTLTPAQKTAIELFAMDMHEPFRAAVLADEDLKSRPIVHDPFHLMKRAGKAVSEIHKDTFFRAGPEMRGLGKGTNWLVLRAWERCSPEDQNVLRCILAFNWDLARARQIYDELRVVLRAPDRATMETGFARILRRTQIRRHVHLRKLHDSLVAHRERILALAEHRPATGRIEALNNNWETLVRRARGYRDLDYLLLKLTFATANPVRSETGTKRFLALGMPEPLAA